MLERREEGVGRSGSRRKRVVREPCAVGCGGLRRERCTGHVGGPDLGPVTPLRGTGMTASVQRPLDAPKAWLKGRRQPSSDRGCPVSAGGAEVHPFLPAIALILTGDEVLLFGDGGVYRAEDSPSDLGRRDLDVVSYQVNSEILLRPRLRRKWLSG